MKTKELPNAKPEPEVFAEDLAIEDMAKQALDSIIESLGESQSASEQAGAWAMAKLIRDISSGRVDPSEAFKAVKSLADKKTPNPVQRMESVVVNLTAILQEHLADDDAMYGMMLERAQASREEIMSKYGLTGTLQLDDDSELEGSDEERPIGMEPEEIKKLRAS